MKQQTTQRKKTRGRNVQSQGVPREVKILGWLSLPLILIAVIVVLTRPSANEQPPVDSTRLVRSDSPVLGAADAPVTLVEFLDPECESCRALFPVVKELLQANGEKVRLVVRYYPLHNNSILAAAATEAAGNQGKYWEMQEMLFTRQPEWGEQQQPQTERMVQYATELGLDRERFIADLSNQQILDKIQRDLADAKALSLRGTPSFFVNGTPVPTLSPDALQAAIDQAQ
ncbi:MAG TPA: thioredoxin domain-containing protein [Herpetosiphonaceae bacterium]